MDYEKGYDGRNMKG